MPPKRRSKDKQTYSKDLPNLDVNIPSSHVVHFTDVDLLTEGHEPITDRGADNYSMYQLQAEIDKLPDSSVESRERQQYIYNVAGLYDKTSPVAYTLLALALLLGDFHSVKRLLVEKGSALSVRDSHLVSDRAKKLAEKSERGLSQINLLHLSLMQDAPAEAFAQSLDLLGNKAREIVFHDPSLLTLMTYYHPRPDDIERLLGLCSKEIKARQIKMLWHSLASRMDTFGVSKLCIWGAHDLTVHNGSNYPGASSLCELSSDQKHEIKRHFSDPDVLGEAQAASFQVIFKLLDGIEPLPEPVDPKIAELMAENLELTEKLEALTARVGEAAGAGRKSKKSSAKAAKAARREAEAHAKALAEKDAEITRLREELALAKSGMSIMSREIEEQKLALEKRASVDSIDLSTSIDSHSDTASSAGSGAAALAPTPDIVGGFENVKSKRRQKTLAEKVTHQAAEITRLHRAGARMQGRLKQADAVKDQYELKLQAARQNVQDAKKAQADAEADQGRMFTSMKAYEARAKDAEAELRKLDKSDAVARDVYDKLFDEYNRVNAEKASVGKELQSVRRQLSRALKEIEEMRPRLTAAWTGRDNAKKEISRMKDTIAVLQRTPAVPCVPAEFITRLASAEDNCAKFSRNNVALSQRCNDLKKRLDRALGAKYKLKAEVEQLTSENERFSEQFTESTTELALKIEKLTLENQALTEQLAVVAVEHVGGREIAPSLSFSGATPFELAAREISTTVPSIMPTLTLHRPMVSLLGLPLDTIKEEGEHSPVG